MSEAPSFNPNEEIKPPVLEVSSATRLPVENMGEYRFNAENNEVIETALKATLEQLGIDPDNVVLTGYLPGGIKISFADELESGDDFHDPSKLQAEKEECQQRLKQLSEGAPEEYPGEAKDEAWRIAQIDTILQKPDGSFYYFAPFDALQREGGLMSGNPIDYAKHEGVIGVYDKERLLAIDPHRRLYTYAGANENWEVIATPDEVESAKVLTFKPRYVPTADGSTAVG